MRAKFKNEWPLHLMLLPGVILVFIFAYMPMFGVAMAFQNYNPGLGVLKSPWVGLENFTYVFNLPGFYDVLRNTIVIALLKIIGMIVVPVTFAILLNEVKSRVFKGSVQTMIYLPHFLSWVILAGILRDVLSPSEGIVNGILVELGIESIYFLADNFWFPIVLVLSEIWKEFGFSSIIYFAALTSLDPTLYEAAYIDGANRWKQTLHVTIPGIMPIIILMTVLSIGNVLNAGFEQIFNLYSPRVYESGDIIDTLVYRIGMIDAQYSVATAIGLFKSFVSLILLATGYKLADKLAGYKIF